MLLIANWKSNKNIDQVKSWLAEIDQHSAKIANLAMVVAPAYPFLTQVGQGLTQLGPNWSLGVQDLSPFPAGSYTGEVGITNLEQLGVKFAILGHSERRKYFAESSPMVANKVEMALSAGMTPILCVDHPYLTKQAGALSDEQRQKCVVAYEPASAIGSGDNEDPALVAEMVAKIKEVFGEVKVIYGGSVNPKNVAQYTAICDGVLVGGASLEAKNFAELAMAA